MLEDATLASCLHNLQELRFHSFGLSRAWVDALSHPAMRLTLLDLYDCCYLDSLEIANLPARPALR